VTLMLFAVGFALFGLAAKYLPIFPQVPVPAPECLPTDTAPVTPHPVVISSC
jgi:hypothetical protein